MVRQSVFVLLVVGLISTEIVQAADPPQDSIGDQSGLKVALPESDVSSLAASITPTIVADAIAQGTANEQSLQDALAVAPVEDASGPELLTDTKVLNTASIGDKFNGAAKAIRTQLNLNADQAKLLRGVDLSAMSTAFNCPYDDTITCDAAEKYRSIDGSCNNLVHPIWGRAVTPLERFLPAQYENVDQLRVNGQWSGNPLPNAREISTRYHQASNSNHLDGLINHMTMELGQLVSHDLVRNSVSRTPYNTRLDCCTGPGGTVTTDPALIALGCNPIPIPANDPFFAQYGRKCLNFVRALSGPDLTCNVGTREQINQVTHYLDGSAFYGSDDATALSIRELTGGRLKTVTSPNGELMPPAPSPNPGCHANPPTPCFIAGDARANQNPPLMTLHTLFVREHNRIADVLASNHQNDPATWDDQKIYQEARRIVVAEFQHITYNEYLPVLISPFWATVFRLLPQTSGYNLEYSTEINPAIRNSFMTSGFRAGHSNIDDIFRPSFFFKDHFTNPSTLYDPSIGIDGLTSDLISSRQQKMDRYKTNQVTNHLFEFAGPGSGQDLAATNIMRGRDHGIPSYNDFRQACNLPVATAWLPFPWGGGFWSHSWGDIQKLRNVYINNSPRDVEAWTAIMSEKRLSNAVFGPTATCIVGTQFYLLKNGDRFFYENNDSTVKFNLAQLDEIRKTSLSRIICDNTGVDPIQRKSLKKVSTNNPAVACNTLPAVNLNIW